MASTFTGFSEEDLKRIKLGHSDITSGELNPNETLSCIRKVDRIGAKSKKVVKRYKLQVLHKQNSDDAIDSMEFSKCKLSIKTPTTPGEDHINNNAEEKDNDDDYAIKIEGNDSEINLNFENKTDSNLDCRKNTNVITPDIVRGVEKYTEDELEEHRGKLQELQLKQKIMEEQNKKRKEMLAKALADRTRQTEEEVLRLEKIKRELQVLDGQFSQDVAVLRKKIDQACLSYSDAEKHYLKVEKEFLHAKINLQKEKEKKELLTEHLCALITHNETRKAQKLETLMLELASDNRNGGSEGDCHAEDKTPVIEDGVDQRTGKMVEISNSS